MKTIDTSGTTFEELISNGYLYVDKTRYLYNLITSGNKYIFLSRPRRFGKSMTLQTFRAIFEGKNELFKDLYIGKETEYNFKEYPVLYLDFGNCEYTKAKEIEQWIKRKVIAFGEANGCQIDSALGVTECLTNIFENLFKQGKQSVILIDEYDRPITDTLKNEEECEKTKIVLRSFYTSLKANTAYIRFVFITGVSKYAKVGVFSGMNNPVNISTNKYYATMLGFTEKELLVNFSEYIDKGVRDLGISRKEYLDKLKEQYDGNLFSLDSKDVETVYNPVSIGLFFTEGYGTIFKNFWMETGGTKLIIDMAKENDFSILTTSELSINYDRVGEDDIATLINNPSRESLLFLMLQTGYLTLKDKDEGGRYILDYPNCEVRTSFSDRLVHSFIKSKNLSETLAENIMMHLRNGEVLEAFKELNTFYASFSYSFFDKNSKERDYMIPLKSLVQGSLNNEIGERAFSELPVSSGSIDYVISLKRYIYIIEAKLNKSSKEALNCILERGYHKKYLSTLEKRKVILVGINFNYSKDTSYKKRLMDDIEIMEKGC